MAVGRSKFNIALTTNTQSKQIGCEIYIRGEKAKDAFSQLEQQKEEIEAILGQLVWHELPDAQDCRIKVSRDGDSKNRHQWHDLHSWLKVQSEAFFEVFSPRVKTLNL
jgi:hypothetical protein